jgi:hypothetical protein
LSRNGCFAGASAAEGTTLVAGATATMGANAPGDAMEFVADSVEAVPDTGKTTGEDGIAFRPATKTVKSPDERAPAAGVFVTTSWALATQPIPSTARRTMTDFLMLFYPEAGSSHPSKRQSACRGPRMQRALNENLCQLGIKRVTASTLRRRGKYLKWGQKPPGVPLGLEVGAARSVAIADSPARQGAID